MRALLVDVAIATGFVAACSGTALILYGLSCDVRHWLHARRRQDVEQPVEQWGNLIGQDVDWSAWERDIA